MTNKELPMADMGPLNPKPVKAEQVDRDAELLPCPFCGSSGETKVGYWPDAAELNWAMRCVCGTSIGLNQGYHDAAEAWNTRHTERARLIAALREGQAGIARKVANETAPTDGNYAKGWYVARDAALAAITTIIEQVEKQP